MVWDDYRYSFYAQSREVFAQRLSGDGISGDTWPLGVSPDGPAANTQPMGPYPNPTRGASSFRFTLSRPGPVHLEVCDIAGRRVQLLASDVMPLGAHTATWNGRDSSGRSAAPGVYLFRLVADGHVIKSTVVVVR